MSQRTRTRDASLWARIACSLLGLCAFAAAPSMNIPDDQRVSADESVLVFQTIASPDTAGQRWSVPVHAWIFELERASLTRKVLTKGFAKAFGFGEDADHNEPFHTRALYFLADNERDKILTAEIAGSCYRLAASDSDGHVREALDLASDVVAGNARDGALTVTIYASIEGDDDRRFTGTILLAERRGISVLSDIDDTIKVSEVLDREKLMANSLLRPFVAVDGMARAFGRWREEGAAFHYLSASPWQLGPSLMPWLDEAGFPRGELHLKSFAWNGTDFFSLFASPKEIKPPLIREVMEAFPDHEFVLVGDSGEADDEIYAAIARAEPSRVRHIYIRNTTREPQDHDRWKRAFVGVPRATWTVFESAEELRPLRDAK